MAAAERSLGVAEMVARAASALEAVVVAAGERSRLVEVGDSEDHSAARAVSEVLERMAAEVVAGRHSARRCLWGHSEL